MRGTRSVEGPDESGGRTFDHSISFMQELIREVLRFNWLMIKYFLIARSSEEELATACHIPSSMSTGSHVNVFSSLLLVIATICCFMSFGHPVRFPSLYLVAAASRLHEGNNYTDQLALLAFKARITDDPFKVLSSWNQSNHFCQWHGVTCGRRHQRVTTLDLASHSLAGSIPPHLGNLSFLTALDLENNSFVGEIPPQLGHLQRLQDLFLNNNSIGGKIPANLSSCSNLLRFRVGSNRLVGEIPAEMGSLSKLQGISLDLNNLTGEIPHSLANLTSLEILDAKRNNLGGSIPDAIGQLTKLTVLSLAENRFSGTMPPSIFNLTSLVYLEVAFNNISGSLPPDFGLTLPNLSFFGIGINRFTGAIPNSISNASNLEEILMTSNRFSGKVPTFEKLHKLRYVALAANGLGSRGVENDMEFFSFLTNATNLTHLGLTYNELGGTIPESICNLSTRLEKISLSENSYIVGSIPAGIVNLESLSWLGLLGNQLTGNIPRDIVKLHMLQICQFGGNKLNGSIPLSIGNLSMVIELRLEENNFQGIIPSTMGKLNTLLVLYLHSNNLSGTIPPQVIGLSSLALWLDLSQNRWSGSLPMEVGNLVNLNSLSVADNLLSGKIPSTLGGCITLEFLDLSGNFFQGFVPSSLRFLRGLQELNLSRNNFSETIPDYLTSFDLKVLDLSYNDFVGEIPIKGVFKNASAISVTGNSELCGGILELQLPRCKFIRPKTSKATVIKLVILLSCGLLAVSLASCFLCKKYGCRKPRKEMSSGLPAIANSLLNISYQSLLKATNGFSSENLLGAGSFGSVYKGILNQDGTTLEVAVKVLNLSRRGAFKSFLCECEVLRNVRHRNLVKVLSACSGSDYQGNDFVALVYEYMVNGNLDEWLHPNPNQGEYEAGPRSLSLLQRLNIAIDVACALDYLHHHAHNSMIHSDLKPSNILLNDDLTGHVGDFGLARLLPNSPYNNSSHQASSSVGLQGTLGYSAPEYGMGSTVSTSGDVYSYGILLLEIFTGKRPTDHMFNENMNLHDYVKKALPERVADVADPIVLCQGERGEMGTNPQPWDQSYASGHKIEECLILLFGIAVSCSEENPSERPDIKGIAAKLLFIKNKFVGTDGGTRGGRVGLEIQK